MKTKDKLEEIIRQNIGALNENEPMEGHFERFRAKLEAQHKRKRFSWSPVLKIAAAVIFVFLSVNQAFIYFSDGKRGLFTGRQDNAEITLAAVSPEYEEVEFYYTNAINVGLEQWYQLKNEGLISEEEQKLMDEEMKDFEVLQKNLQADLAANPHDERVINAMLEYYQTKLNLINMIVAKLQEVKALSRKSETNKNI